MNPGVRFHKTEQCGNDYVVVDVGSGPGAVDESRLGDVAETARRVSDRHTGVGSDGLILVDRVDDGAPRMRMWNADGSRGRLCLNGLCQVAILAHAKDGADRFTVHTDAGPRRVAVDAAAPDGPVVTVEADAPDYARSALPATGDGDELWGEPLPGGEVPLYGVSVGNPHAVFWSRGSEELLQGAQLSGFARQVADSGVFPEGVNLHMAMRLAPDRIAMRSWERGSGPTRACGSGALAVFAVAHRLGRAGEAAAMEQPGGAVRVAREGAGFTLAGRPRHVADGVWFDPRRA